MSLGDRLVMTAYGRVSNSLQMQMEKNFRRYSQEVIRLALTRWASLGHRRYSDREADCSLQVVVMLEELVRTESRFGNMFVDHEHHQISPEMVAGDAPANKAARPDIKISARGGTAAVIEAKRLADEQSLCSAYVKEGMTRFVKGFYSVPDGMPMMLGYVFSSASIESIRARVNGVIADHPSMDSGDLVHPTTTPTVLAFDGVSTHAGSLEIAHLWVHVA